MAKIQRNFRINQDLDFRLKEIAEAQGISISQLIELACYSLVDEKKPIEKSAESNAKRDKRVTVYLRTDSKTYKKLASIVEQKNNTISQEINFRLRASLTDGKFDLIELNTLQKAMYDLNRLGGLLKLSLNNDLNTPELLEEINKNINELWDYLREIVYKSSDRN